MPALFLSSPKKFVLSIGFWGLLSLSGICYAASFLWSRTLFWLMIPGLVVLGILFVQRRLTLGRCFVWALWAFGLRLIDVFCALVRSSGIAWWVGFVGWLLMTVYVVVQVGLIVGAGSALRKRWCGQDCFCPIILYGITLIILHWFLVSGLFWMMGRFEGEASANPLVPWFCGCAPYVMGGQEPPLFVRRCGAVQLPFKPFVSFCGTDQVACLSRALTKLPGASLVFLPESAFPFCLNDDAPTLAALSLLSRERAFILCGHRGGADGRSYGCCYSFANGELSAFCDKYHLMFFIEREPMLFGLRLPKALQRLYDAEDFFSPGPMARTPFQVPTMPPLFPLICSEVFMTDGVAHIPAGAVGVALVNDAWFVGSSQPDLMFGVALFKAWWAQKPLFYISYEHATYVDGGALAQSAELPFVRC